MEGENIDELIYSISYYQPYNEHLEDLDPLKIQCETVLQNYAVHCGHNNYYAQINNIIMCNYAYILIVSITVCTLLTQRIQTHLSFLHTVTLYHQYAVNAACTPLEIV